MSNVENMMMKFYSTECPPDKPHGLCTFTPCAQKICAGYPEAVCMNDPCGNCENKWYLDGKQFECSK